MDQLQLALDRLESSNAGIHEELLELLQSNREIRMAFNQDSTEDGDCDENDSGEKQVYENQQVPTEKCNAAGDGRGEKSMDPNEGTPTLAKDTQQSLSPEPRLADLRIEDTQNGTD